MPTRPRSSGSDPTMLPLRDLHSTKQRGKIGEWVESPRETGPPGNVSNDVRKSLVQSFGDLCQKLDEQKLKAPEPELLCAILQQAHAQAHGRWIDESTLLCLSEVAESLIPDEQDDPGGRDGNSRKRRERDVSKPLETKPNPKRAKVGQVAENHSVPEQPKPDARNQSNHPRKALLSEQQVESRLASPKILDSASGSGTEVEGIHPREAIVPAPELQNISVSKQQKSTRAPRRALDSVFGLAARTDANLARDAPPPAPAAESGSAPAQRKPTEAPQRIPDTASAVGSQTESHYPREALRSTSTAKKRRVPQQPNLADVPQKNLDSSSVLGTGKESDNPRDAVLPVPESRNSPAPKQQKCTEDPVRTLATASGLDSRTESHRPRKALRSTSKAKRRQGPEQPNPADASTKTLDASSVPGTLKESDNPREAVVAAPESQSSPASKQRKPTDDPVRSLDVTSDLGPQNESNPSPKPLPASPEVTNRAHETLSAAPAVGIRSVADQKRHAEDSCRILNAPPGLTTHSERNLPWEALPSSSEQASRHVPDQWKPVGAVRTFVDARSLSFARYESSLGRECPTPAYLNRSANPCDLASAMTTLYDMLSKLPGDGEEFRRLQDAIEVFRQISLPKFTSDTSTQTYCVMTERASQTDWAHADRATQTPELMVLTSHKQVQTEELSVWTSTKQVQTDMVVTGPAGNAPIIMDLEVEKPGSQPPTSTTTGGLACAVPPVLVDKAVQTVVNRSSVGPRERRCSAASGSRRRKAPDSANSMPPAATDIGGTSR